MLYGCLYFRISVYAALIMNNRGSVDTTRGTLAFVTMSHKWAYGKSGNPDPEPEPESGIRNRNRKRNRNWRNKWMLQVGKYDSHQNSSSLLCIPRKMDDDTPNFFKKRYVYIEHSSYHSFQLNWVTQNIFAFVGHNNTGELVEMWIRVKNFWLHNLCKTKTLTL